MDMEARAHSEHPEALRLWLRLLTCTQLVEKQVRTLLREQFDTTLPRFDLMAQLERAQEELTRLERGIRAEFPGVRVIVHPECRNEVVSIADEVGSTEKIIQAVSSAPAGTKWVIGTELNLVQRLAKEHPEQEISFLEKNVCYCSTMNRIDLPHLVWALEELVAGRVPNQITVDERTAHHARVALDQMLALP